MKTIIFLTWFFWNISLSKQDFTTISRYRCVFYDLPLIPNLPKLSLRRLKKQIIQERDTNILHTIQAEPSLEWNVTGHESHTKHTNYHQFSMVARMKYLRELYSIPRFRVYHRDVPDWTDYSSLFRELDCCFSRGCSINVEFASLRTTVGSDRSWSSLIAGTRRRSLAKWKKKKTTARRLAPKKARARASAKSIAISARGSPGRSNETGGQAATARPPMSRTSHLQSTTSSQAQIKCSLYPPCFPTTIINHHHRRHHQHRGCRAHGLQLRRALCE